jgi:Kelch motif
MNYSRRTFLASGLDLVPLAAPLPRGANHVGVACMDARLYATGGFIEQNRRPHNECFVYDARAERWEPIAYMS